MLNLGDVNQGAVASDESFEDVYIEFLEADQAFVNLMNAMEIAEKAQASGSMECMSFAEDLLGASCEVVTTGSSKKITDNAFTAIENAKKMATSLKAKADILRSKHKGDRDVNVTISVGLANAADRYDENRFKLMEFCSTTTKGTTTVPLANALNIIKNAMTYVIYSLDQFNRGTKAQVRAGFKNEGKGSIKADGGMSIMTVYKRARTVVAALLSAARAGLKACNRAVMQANRPARARIEI